MDGKSSLGIDENLAGLLCYVGLWISGLILYSLERKSDFVKFHAKQAIVTFLPLTILIPILEAILPWSLLQVSSIILGPIILILWVICMIKAYQGEKWRVPLIGDLLERSFTPVDNLKKMEEKRAGFLCYTGLFVTGLILYLLERDSDFVKFHAKQSLITFSTLFLLTWIVGYVPVVGWIFRRVFIAIVIILWVICMVKAYQGEKWKVPILGELVE